MADEETRQLSKDLESLQETLEAATPAQIPLLDDVVDEEELRQHAPAPPRRRRAPRNPGMNPQPPQTGDLFHEPDEAAAESREPAQSRNDDRPWQSPARPDSTDGDGQVDPIEYARPGQRADTRDMLKLRADRMVEDLVAEYSLEIIGRLKSELTERLYAILEDLNIDQDDDSRSS